MKKPELLAPAGSLKHQEYAYVYGADAVYAGMPRYSLRVRNNSYDKTTIQRGIEMSRALGKKFFLTCNLMPHGAKLKTFVDDVQPFFEMHPDAAIMADPGLIAIVRENWPEVPIHLSVQANTVNAAGVKFWESFGIKRVILSRELSLEEVDEIRQACPDTEIEVFIHGALCIAYSGRCMLSGYMSKRDANQGSCTNSCRWNYKASPAATAQVDSSDARHSLADEPWLLEEAQRPGESMPIFEDEHGTYIMNSKDLRAIEHVQRLVEIGVDSLKIEGRTKSFYYAARVTRAYRQAIDDAAGEQSFEPKLISELEKLSSRGYTSGFYQRHNHADYQNYESNSSNGTSQIFVAEVIEQDTDGMATVDVKNKIEVGDRLELVTPEGAFDLTLESMLDDKGVAAMVAPGSGYRMQVKLPVNAKFGLLARYL